MTDANSARADKGPADHQTQPRRAWRRSRRCPPGYLSVADLAERGPLSLSGFYVEIKEKRLPAGLWRGKLLVVAERDFEAWRESVVPHDPGPPANVTDRASVVAEVTYG